MNDEGDKITPETESELLDRQPEGTAEESRRPEPGPPCSSKFHSNCYLQLSLSFSDSVNYRLAENLEEDISEQGDQRFVLSLLIERVTDTIFART